jgi:hypothetical protein
LEGIERSAFSFSGLKAAVIPASVKVLFEACFRSCDAFICVTFEPRSALECIKNSVLGDTSLRSTVLPNISALGSLAFESEPISQQTGGFSFSGTGLEKLILPLAIEVKGAFCFSHSHSPEPLACEAALNLQRIEKNTFDDTSLSEVELPNSVRYISSLAFDGKLLKSVLFYHCPTNLRARGKMLEDTSGGAPSRCLGWAVSLVISKSVETIGDSCFMPHKTHESAAVEAPQSGCADS